MSEEQPPITYYYDANGTEPPMPPFPMPKVGDRFMIDDVPVIVTAVHPGDDEDTKSFSIHLDEEELDGDESYPEEATLPFWNRGEIKE